MQKHRFDKQPTVAPYTVSENEMTAAELGALAFRLDEAQKTDQAIVMYKKAIAANPDFAEAYYNLGVIYSGQPDNTDAVDCFRKAMILKPDFPQPYIALAMIWCGLNRFEEALVLLEQAVAIDSDVTEAHYNMGLVLQHMGEYHRSLECFDKARTCNPVFAPAHWLSLLSLPMIYDTQEQLVSMRRRFSTNLDRLAQTLRLDTHAQIEYAAQGINTATNFYLQYQGHNDKTLQVKYGRLVQDVMTARYPHWSRNISMPPLGLEEKIRIGYVSSFMCDHTVGTFLAGWVENQNQDRFQIHCYHMGSKDDATTTRFRRISHRFHHFPCDVEAAASQIASDRLHILIYTDIGMNTETLQLAALRLAPVQCKGWGHPVTTGLPTIDHYLSSDLMEPENAREHYSENLVRLPNLALSYRPPELPLQPATRQELGLPTDRFIYLTTQSIFKYLPQYDAIYPLIAKEVPHACFVFIGHQSRYATRRFRHRLEKAFSRHGLEADDFCHFMQRLEFNEFLSLNLSADLLLDTLEWSGGKTTLEAIGCGLPVVTCPGRFMRGRHAYAMLKMMGLSDTIARDTAEYINIASRMAMDGGFHDRVKQQIIDRRHRLYNDQVFMRGLEDFYEGSVRQAQAVMPPMDSTGKGNACDPPGNGGAVA